MMKVLSVIHYPYFGGPHNRNSRLIPRLRQQGIETWVLLPDEKGNAKLRLQAQGINVLTLPLHRLRAKVDVKLQWQFWWQLWPEIQSIRRLIQAYEIDLVQINGLVNPHAAIAARLEHKPVVWQLLDTRPPMILRWMLMQLVKRLATVVMSTGLEVAKVHPQAMSFGKNLVPFFPPVDTQAFRYDAKAKSQARAALHLPQDAIVIGTVGNLTPQKGHEYLIQAFARLKSAFPQLYVCILGGQMASQSSYEQGLHQQAEKLGLLENKRLQIIDPQHSVYERLPAFDIFTLTSVPRSEGVPTAILEAMACALPVVATDVGSIAEVVIDSKTGLVVPALDIAAMLTAYQLLLKDENLRQTMGSEARKQAVAKYDIAICAKTHQQVYQQAIASL